MWKKSKLPDCKPYPIATSLMCLILPQCAECNPANAAQVHSCAMASNSLHLSPHIVVEWCVRSSDLSLPCLLLHPSRCHEPGCVVGQIRAPWLALQSIGTTRSSSISLSILRLQVLSLSSIAIHLCRLSQRRLGKAVWCVASRGSTCLHQCRSPCESFRQFFLFHPFQLSYGGSLQGFTKRNLASTNWTSLWTRESTTRRWDGRGKGNANGGVPKHEMRDLGCERRDNSIQSHGFCLRGHGKRDNPTHSESS